MIQQRHNNSNEHYLDNLLKSRTCSAEVLFGSRLLEVAPTWKSTNLRHLWGNFDDRQVQMWAVLQNRRLEGLRLLLDRNGGDEKMHWDLCWTW